MSFVLSVFCERHFTESVEADQEAKPEFAGCLPENFFEMKALHQLM
jgi:hypothetical protein